MEPIEKIRQIILDNNFLDTEAGQRFVEWNRINDIQAVISFSGRSKNQQCYRITASSDSDSLYVTHLYIDRWGDIKVQLGSEDTDDFAGLLYHPSNEPITNFDPETIKEWISLLTF